NRGFLREVPGAVEDLVADGRLRHDGLDEARAVTHLQEVDLPARPAVDQPAENGDGLSVVAGDVLDVGAHLSSAVSALGEVEGLREIIQYRLNPPARGNRPVQGAFG